MSPRGRRVVQCLLLAGMLASASVLAAAPTTASWSVGEPIFTYGNWRPPTELRPTLESLYGWPSGFDPTTLTPEIARQAAEAGFNLVWINDLSQLQIAESYGLRAQLIISGQQPQNNLFFERPDGWPQTVDQPAVNALIDQFKASPAAYSYFIIDEPGATRFDHLAAIVAYLKQRDPAHLAYINLFPSDEITGDLQTTDYGTYLDKYLRTVQPALLSYDSYNLFANGDRGLFLGNMQRIARAAAQARIPFMTYVQGYQMDPKRHPLTADEMRFLTYTPLAFGAQGISYFNYWAPRGPATGGLAPFPDGKPTAVYEALQTLSGPFKRIASQFSRLRWLGTYLKGYAGSAMPRFMTPPPAASSFDVPSLVNDMSYINGTPLKGALLGYFGASDCSSTACATHVLLQNLDYTSSRVYRLQGPGPLSVYDARTGRWIPSAHNYADLALEPGGCALVALASLRN
jgi:hypothetical protein